VDFIPEIFVDLGNDSLICKYDSVEFDAGNEGIDFKWFIEAAGRRQKWIDQSQSVNLFLLTPDLKTLSHMYRAAWRSGLKTTYYLRSQQASNVEKASVKKNHEMRGHVGTSNTEEAKREFTAEEKMACSIEAMKNGEECEACQ